MLVRDLLSNEECPNEHCLFSGSAEALVRHDCFNDSITKVSNCVEMAAQSHKKTRVDLANLRVQHINLKVERDQLVTQGEEGRRLGRDLRNDYNRLLAAHQNIGAERDQLRLDLADSGRVVLEEREARIVISDELAATKEQLEKEVYLSI